MTTNNVEQLKQAMRAAHEAGDRNGAARLAAMIEAAERSDIRANPVGAVIPQGASNEFGLPQDVYADIMARTGNTGDRRRDTRTKRRRLKERERLIKLEQLRQVNPYQAAQIEDMSTLDNFLVGTGRGFSTVARGLGMMEKEDEFDLRSMEQLKQISPTGGAVTAGEFVGETAPFLAAGGGAGAVASKVPMLSSTAARVAGAGLLGASEGGIISQGRGQDPLAGAGIGGGVALAIEMGIPVVGRGLGSVYRRMTGKAPTVPLIKATGEPTDHLVSVLSANGVTYNDAVKDAMSIAQEGGQRVDELGQVTQLAGETVTKPTTDRVSTLAAEVEVNPATIEAAERLGVADQMPLSAASQNPQFQDFEMGLATIIGSETATKKARFIDQMSLKADEIIKEFGGDIDTASMSNRITQGVEDTRLALQDEANALYNAIGDAIPGDEVVDVSGLGDVLSQRLAVYGGDVSELSPVEKKLYRFVSDPDKVVTYELIDRERKLIGEQLAKKSTPFENASEAELSKYYGVLTDIQGQIADNPIYGVQGVWDQAKNLTAQKKGIEGAMIDALGRNLQKSIIPELGAVVRRASVDELRNFDRVMAAIPEDMRQEAMATSLRYAFTNGGRNASQLTMPGYASWYEGLQRSPTLKNKLFQHFSEDQVSRLDDLYKVSKGWSAAAKRAAPTGRIQTLLRQFDKKDGIVSRLYNIASTAQVDPAFSALASTLSGNGVKQSTLDAADSLMASPQFTRAVLVAASNPASQAARRTRRALIDSRAYNDWVATLPEATRAEIATVGIIPWLIEGEGDEAQENN